MGTWNIAGVDYTDCFPLVVDRFKPDGVIDPDALIQFGHPFYGLILKLDQGTNDAFEEAPWCKAIFDRMQQRPQWGGAFVGGLYDYVDYHEEGPAQAEYSWRLVEKFGLRGRGFLPMMFDSERGGQRPADLTKTRVEQVFGSCVARYKELSGEADATMYAGELHRALGITGHLGCTRVIVACYGRWLPPTIYTAMGWPWPEGWQYVGTDTMPDEAVLHFTDKKTGAKVRAPVVAPGCSGLSDLTAWTAKPDPLVDLLGAATGAA